MLPRLDGPPRIPSRRMRASLYPAEVRRAAARPARARAPGRFGWDAERAFGRLGQQAAVAAHTVLLAPSRARPGRRSCSRVRRSDPAAARPARRRRPSLRRSPCRSSPPATSPRRPGCVISLLDRLMPRLHAAVADLRALVNDLRPPTLDELGLASAVRGSPDGSRPRARTSRSEWTCWANCRPPSNRGHRIAAEPLTNAVRHAGASRVDVPLRRHGLDLIVELADDGLGFQPGAPPAATTAREWACPRCTSGPRARRHPRRRRPPVRRGCVRAVLPLAPARAVVS